MRLGLGAAGVLLWFAGWAEAQDQPWRPLFDGSTSKGWVEAAGKPFPANSWTIEDGCLKALAHAEGPDSIRTTETFRSFELQFEWKLSKLGNSAVRYLMQANGRGLEYPLVDIYSMEPSDPTRITGALFSILPPAGANWKLGVFNESRVIVHGEHVEHWLNGVRVLSFELTNPAVQAVRSGAVIESPIALVSRATETWFRNLKIRVLP